MGVEGKADLRWPPFARQNQCSADASRASGARAPRAPPVAGTVPIMFLDSLLALGLVLSTATQLRFGDTPFGSGEMCLVLWLGLLLCLQPRRAALRSYVAFVHVAAFWLILFVA